MKQILTFDEIKGNVEVQTYLKHRDYALLLWKMKKRIAFSNVI